MTPSQMFWGLSVLYCGCKMNWAAASWVALCNILPYTLMTTVSNLYTTKITNQLVFAEQTLLAQAWLHSDLCPSSIPLVSYNLTFQSAWLHKLYTCWQDLAFKLWNGQPDSSIGNSYCYSTRLVDHSIQTKHQSVASTVYIYIATVFCLQHCTNYNTQSCRLTPQIIQLHLASN